MNLDVGSLTENSVISGKDGGRSITNIIYILYLVGFVFPLTALIGAILAYTNKDQAESPYKSHLEFQLNIFIKGVIFNAGIWGAYILLSLVTIFTFGFGAVLYVIPIGIGVWWFIWTLIRIIRGMQTLGRREAMGHS